MTFQLYNEEPVEDIGSEVNSMNSGNSWLDHLQGGQKKRPYLESVGRKRKKPKKIHVSASQRRAFLNG